MRQNIVRHEAMPGGTSVMEFVEVTDFGAKEINVSGVASVKRITQGQVRITYFVSRNEEAVAAVHLVWDYHEWLNVWRVWEEARAEIIRECIGFGRGGYNHRLRGAH
jgi:hypothetical protein